MLHKDLTQRIINAAKTVHTELGPGMPHDFYRKALETELRDAGIMIEVDKPVKVHYRDTTLGEMGVDFCIDNAILAMCVDGDEIHPEDYGRLRTYLKSLVMDVGLLLKFNGQRLDIRRVETTAKAQAPES